LLSFENTEKILLPITDLPDNKFDGFAFRNIDQWKFCFINF